MHGLQWARAPGRHLVPFGAIWCSGEVWDTVLSWWPSTQRLLRLGPHRAPGGPGLGAEQAWSGCHWSTYLDIIVNMVNTTSFVMRRKEGDTGGDAVFYLRCRNIQNDCCCYSRSDPGRRCSFPSSQESTHIKGRACLGGGRRSVAALRMGCERATREIRVRVSEG